MLTESLLRVLLILMIAIPVVAAAVVASLGKNRLHLVRTISLSAVVVNLLFAILIAVGFVSLGTENTGTTFAPSIVPGALDNASGTSWKMLDFGEQGGVDFYLGVDGLNVWLIVLTSLLMVSAVLVSWKAISDRNNEYYAWMLLLGTGMLGVFVAFDIILFYVFFELTLVPLYFLIGIWGGPQRRHAANKFFIYTLAGSVITLLGLLLVVVTCYDHSNTLSSARDASNR